MLLGRRYKHTPSSPASHIFSNAKMKLTYKSSDARNTSFEDESGQVMYWVNTPRGVGSRTSKIIKAQPGSSPDQNLRGSVVGEVEWGFGHDKLRFNGQEIRANDYMPSHRFMWRYGDSSRAVRSIQPLTASTDIERLLHQIRGNTVGLMLIYDSFGQRTSVPSLCRTLRRSTYSVRTNRRTSKCCQEAIISSTRSSSRSCSSTMFAR